MLGSFLDELEVIGQVALGNGSHLEGLVVHEVVQVAVVVAVAGLDAVDKGLLKLGGGVERGFGHSASHDVLHLGADEGGALTGLDVPELDDHHQLAFVLEGLAVAEITGSNHNVIPP